ncbi:MAG TPA: polyphenol oxidase family protein, partial [Candidatus Lustribacter sp.]|nr:polyphenol oxidase family protein [Candidatus Lustribacter sp.]
MFFWREDVPRAGGHGGYTWGFTSAPGGHSRPPYDGWNLGAHVGDDPAAVRANRAALAERLGVREPELTFMNQVHGAAVARVGPSGWLGPAPACDAVVTAAAGRALVVLVADCAPVLLVDPVSGLCAAVHAGRRGLVSRVVPRAVEALRSLGSRDLRAVVGPSICAGCYE